MKRTKSGLSGERLGREALATGDTRSRPRESFTGNWQFPKKASTEENVESWSLVVTLGKNGGETESWGGRVERLEVCVKRQLVQETNRTDKTWPFPRTPDEKRQ